ncbi:hypothetical protein C0989_005842 [Termitomyces sp. Mn162]|nr:hypothetical protein C0989_005842 [Termitomyces sp. Mn162]
MRLHVERPYPLHSARIEFNTLPPPPFPPTAARMEFGSDNPNAAMDAEARDADSEPDLEPPHSPETPRTRSSISRKIPRPHGEPGRPNSGGFNLAIELAKTGWSRKSVEQLAETVHAVAQERLDLTKCYRKQDKRDVKKICDEMIKDKNWPKLKDYEGCWPVLCILKSKLKNGAAAARRNELRDTQARLQAVMNRRGMSPNHEQ